MIEIPNDIKLSAGDRITVKEKGGYYLNPKTSEPQEFLVTERTETGYNLKPCENK